MKNTLFGPLESLNSLRAEDRLPWWLMAVARRQSWSMRSLTRVRLDSQVLVRKLTVLHRLAATLLRVGVDAAPY